MDYLLKEPKFIALTEMIRKIDIPEYNFSANETLTNEQIFDCIIKVSDSFGVDEWSVILEMYNVFYQKYYIDEVLHQDVMFQVMIHMDIDTVANWCRAANSQWCSSKEFWNVYFMNRFGVIPADYTVREMVILYKELEKMEENDGLERYKTALLLSVDGKARRVKDILDFRFVVIPDFSYPLCVMLHKDFFDLKRDRNGRFIIKTWLKRLFSLTELTRYYSIDSRIARTMYSKILNFNILDENYGLSQYNMLYYIFGVDQSGVDTKHLWKLAYEAIHRYDLTDLTKISEGLDDIITERLPIRSYDAVEELTPYFLDTHIEYGMYISKFKKRQFLILNKDQTSRPINVYKNLLVGRLDEEAYNRVGRKFALDINGHVTEFIIITSFDGNNTYKYKRASYSSDQEIYPNWDNMWWAQYTLETFGIRRNRHRNADGYIGRLIDITDLVESGKTDFSDIKFDVLPDIGER